MRDSRRRAACGLPVSLLCLALGVAPACRRDRSAEFTTAMNLGKAHLELRDSARAIDQYALAVSLASDSPAAWRNLARGHLLARDEKSALTALERARALETESAATSYLTGLAHAHRSQFELAAPHFLDAIRLDPRVATVHYQLASAYLAAHQTAPAVEQLRETLRLDPLHASAHYRLASHAGQMGDREARDRHQREFDRLRRVFGEDSRTPEMLEVCVYTRPEPGPAGTLPEDGPDGGGAPHVRFREATHELLPPGSDGGGIVDAAILEMDDQGRYTLLVLGRDGRLRLLVPHDGKGLQWAAAEVLPTRGSLPVEGARCVVGDFHDDPPENASYDPLRHAWNDVLLIGGHGARLLKRTGARTFDDVSAAAGLAGLAGRHAEWVDYEHDGDLDLLVVSAAGVQLWQSNGDGEFEEVLARMELGELQAALGVALSDLDSNLAVDLVVARGGLPTLVLENRRDGSFTKREERGGAWPSAVRALADDLDNDGQPDVVLVGRDGVRILPGRGPTRPRLDLGGMEPAAAALIDFDNDGWLDICVAGGVAGEPDASRLVLWRNSGMANWLDATPGSGLAALRLPADVRDVRAADLDADGDSDLWITSGAGMHFLRNEGGSLNHQLKVRLVGLKTNPSGFGAHVEVRSGRIWLTRAVTAPFLEIGLGRATHLDSVQTVWTNGIVDNQIAVAVADRPLIIAEKNVPAGSCPYLYAWDGRGFRFVTDILGNSPLGLPARRGLLVPSDPDELAWIGTADDFPPRGGSFVLQITNELREVLYLDEARLVVVDHPPGLEVHSTDKLVAPPFPPSAIEALVGARAPRHAVGDDGVDRTRPVQALDGEYSSPGLPLLPPFHGVTKPLALTLDFGPIDGTLPLMLALTGWLQYGDASTNIALSQSGRATVIFPRLEAQDDGGRWRNLDVAVGMPAGKTKTILVDLEGKLPRNTRMLRLVTSLELRWDRIALFERAPRDRLAIHDARAAAARLDWRGFSALATRAPQHPLTPDFDAVSSQPAWRTVSQGWATRHGDVLELVAQRDGLLVVASAGDGLELSFSASSFPPLPAGRRRSFFLYSVGWDKALHPNAVDDETIEPLPVDQGLSQDRQDEYNSRWIPADRFASQGRGD